MNRKVDSYTESPVLYMFEPSNSFVEEETLDEDAVDSAKVDHLETVQSVRPEDMFDLLHAYDPDVPKDKYYRNGTWCMKDLHTDLNLHLKAKVAKLKTTLTVMTAKMVPPSHWFSNSKCSLSFCQK